jgi:hypothetical protein
MRSKSKFVRPYFGSEDVNTMENLDIACGSVTTM